MQAAKFDEKKFRELVVYVASKCEGDVYFGATKLNKILFYSDFLCFERFGKPITGADYLALERGPAPKQLVPEREFLELDGAIVLVKRQRQHRIVPLRDPDLSLFSGHEIAIVDEVIELLRNVNADQVSEFSHAFLGWKAARAEAEATGRQVTIPYGTAFVSNRRLDEFEEARILECAKEQGWPIQ
jgi:hypothetical protein